VARVGRSRRRRLIAGVVATGVVPAVLYIGVTGLGGDETTASAPGDSASTAATAPPTPPASVAASASTTPTSRPTPTASATPSDPAESVQGEALAALETLPVKGRAPTTGYDRDQFGPAWADVDGNGCDTRNDILARDLTEAVLDADACTVSSGLLAGPYSRAWIRFVRGEDTSALVQIDHVVALSDAWQKGAQLLSPVQRERFANDPLNLLAVDGGLNQQKGDGDAATWLPLNKGFRCDYVARQVAVKARYDLWVTSAERDAIARILSTCPGQPLPDGRTAPDVTPAGAPPPAGAGVSSGAAGSVGGEAGTGPGSRPDGAFANCTEAREAGAAPVLRDEPGYGTHLDGDGDGIACE
jgi:hypothetical protein